jgi:hypothetical protein
MTDAGILRLRQVALVANDLDAVVNPLIATFGLAVAFRDPAVARFGLHNAVLPAGNQFIEVVAPTRDGTAAGRYLARRGGDGGYMVILQAEEHSAWKHHVAGLGIRSALELDSDHYRMMQLHPADTGGTFLEIDEQLGGEQLDGPWEPAGPEWLVARRTDVIAGITAAEIQSPEPDRLAARWANILQRSLERTEAGWEIMLDNASLRFVSATDGRGEGLSGIDLQPAASPRADSGRAGAEMACEIGGVRIRLG